MTVEIADIVMGAGGHEGDLECIGDMKFPNMFGGEIEKFISLLRFDLIWI